MTGKAKTAHSALTTIPPQIGQSDQGKYDHPSRVYYVVV